MGRGSRVAAGLDNLDSYPDWRWCSTALPTYKDSAAAAAGRKELIFGVPEWMGARAVAASGAGGGGDEGITLFEPYGLPPVQRSRHCRALSLGLSLEESPTLGWAMSRGSRGSCAWVFLSWLVRNRRHRGV